jgi:hypothetical protein
MNPRMGIFRLPEVGSFELPLTVAAPPLGSRTPLRRRTARITLMERGRVRPNASRTARCARTVRGAAEVRCAGRGATPPTDRRPPASGHPSFRKGGGRVDAPGRRMVRAEGSSAF